MRVKLEKLVGSDSTAWVRFVLDDECRLVIQQGDDIIAVGDPDIGEFVAALDEFVRTEAGV